MVVVKTFSMSKSINKTNIKMLFLRKINTFINFDK